MKMFVLILALLGGCISISAQTPEWVAKVKELQRFPATEKDVVSAFDNPKIISESGPRPNDALLTRSVDYEIPEGRLNVYYSGGRCSETNTRGYDLDEGVILSFNLRLKSPIEISKTGMKIKKLDRVPDVHSMHVYYHDPRKGIRYTVLNEKLQAVYFSVPDKFIRKCSEK